MNGGGAALTQDEQTITRIPPLGYGIDDQLQVYAPIASDHVYTNSWQGPFYGFNRVIETMQLTNSPFRLKPLHIHYHFYSASKIASINALKSVYDWSIKQESRAVWVSEYSRKVNDFQNVTLSRRMDGAWDIRGLNALRTLRLSETIGWPDLKKSKGLLGYVMLVRDDMYIFYLIMVKFYCIQNLTPSPHLPTYYIATEKLKNGKKLQEALIFGCMPICH